MLLFGKNNADIRVEVEGRRVTHFGKFCSSELSRFSSYCTAGKTIAPCCASGIDNLVCICSDLSVLSLFVGIYALVMYSRLNRSNVCGDEHAVHS